MGKTVIIPSFKLFFEAVDDNVKNTLIDSIEGRYVTYFYYSGDKHIAKGYRWVEPVCLGYSLAGNLVVRAFQLRENPSKSHHKPMWRLFRLDRISDISQSLRRFNTPRPGYNPDGDRSMRKVIINSQF